MYGARSLFRTLVKSRVFCGIVRHERLFGGQAGLQNQGFPFAGFKHVQVEAHMRGKKAFLVKRRLARSRDADEEDGFHRYFSVDLR